MKTANKKTITRNDPISEIPPHRIPPTSRDSGTRRATIIPEALPAETRYSYVAPKGEASRREELVRGEYRESRGEYRESRGEGSVGTDTILSFLERLQFLHEGLIPGPEDLRVINALWADTETRDYVKQRGARYFLSELGRRRLEWLKGESHPTQIRCMSDDVARAKQFQSRARREENESFELKDVVRVWSEALDWDTYVQLRALGVRLGLHTDGTGVRGAAGAFLRLLAQRLQTASPLEADRLIAAIVGTSHTSR